jgi:chloramphenicol 3-O phosphotransferase
MAMNSSLILLNGASSAGKTTLCKAVREHIPAPFLHFSLDFFMFDADVLPKRRDPELGISWGAIKPKLFDGFYRCLPALLSAGNNLVVDMIIENDWQKGRLLEELHGFDVFLVGVHCPLPELERREQLRGDRRTGDAATDFLTVHSFLPYDFTVDSSLAAAENADKIVKAWQERSKSGVFAQAWKNHSVMARDAQ